MTGEVQLYFNVLGVDRNQILLSIALFVKLMQGGFGIEKGY